MTNQPNDQHLRDDTSHADEPPIEHTKIRYRVWPDQDGVDDTFEVESKIEGGRIAWTAYWKYDMPPEAERRAKRHARLVAQFLELIANNSIYLDLRQLNREVLHWRIVHGVEYMRRNYPTLSEPEILAFFHRVGYDQVDSSLDDYSLLCRYEELLNKTA